MSDENEKQEDIARTTAEIPGELHRRLKARLALRGMTFSDWLREQAEREVALGDKSTAK